MNADMPFFVVFKVFSLWVHRRTRDKFTFVGRNRFTDHSFSTLQDHIEENNIFVEYDGKGPSLDNDDYIRRAVVAYDSAAESLPFPPQTE